MRRDGRWMLALALLAAWPARAYDNDLALSKLGSPVPIKNGADVRAPDALAQERFARFATDFALAVTPLPSGLPSSLGDAGFEMTLTFDVARAHRKQKFSDGQTYDVWPTEKAGNDQFFMPALQLRKGLPFGFEVGSYLSYLAYSSMVATTANVKWALLEGFHLVPDLSIGAFATTVMGTGAMSLVTGGWDVSIGERFAPGGGAEFALYGGVQRLGMNASTNNIDFDPTIEDARNPNADDGVFQEIKFGPAYKPSTAFWRFYGGAQFRMAALVLGLEGGYASGDNPIAEGSATRVQSGTWKVATRIGVSF